MECPSCGASVEIPDAAAKTVYCEYCAQPLVVMPEGCSASGKPAKLIETARIAQVGQHVSIRGTRYQVSGMVQYAYEDGTYDQYLLTDNQNHIWLEQDEGEFRLFDHMVPAPGAPQWDDLGVGEKIPIAGGVFYTMEFGEGAVVGGAGWLPMLALPGTGFLYIDGTWNGEAATLAYSAAAGTYLLHGATLYRDDIVVE
jgi:hypothetical protein